MSYTVHLVSSAVQSLNSLGQVENRRISQKMNSLAKNPRPAQAKMLTSKEKFWRLRVGDYRIIYQIDDRTKKILVVVIGHRREVYRKF